MELQTDKLGKVSITVEEGYWDVNKDYDKLTVVEKEGVFGTFISRKPVPAGTELTNRKYWIPFSSLKEEILVDYNAFLDKYKDQLDSYDGAIEDFKDKTSEIDDSLNKVKEGLELIDDLKEGLNTLNTLENRIEQHKNDNSNPHNVTKSQVGLENVTNDAQVKRSEMGVASGIATLDTNGHVPSSQLPSYVDDVLEYNNKSSFPTTGETGKIYVDTTTNLTYRWSGSQYVEISQSLALGETSSTAYSGDKGAQLKIDLNRVDAYVNQLHNIIVDHSSKFRRLRTGYDSVLPVVYLDKALDNEYHIHWDIADSYYAINPINDSKGISKNLLYSILKGTAEGENVAFIRGSLPISFRNIDSTRLEALKYVDVVGLVSGGITDGSCSAIAFGKVHEDYKITNYIFRLDITTHVNDIYVVFNHIDLTNVQTLASNTKFGFIRGLDFNDVLLQKYGVRIINGEGHVQLPTADETKAGLLSKEDKIKLDGIQANANNYELPTATNKVKGGIMLDGPFIVDDNGHLMCKSATATQNGLMSASDKQKLDNIDIATNTTAGLVKTYSNPPKPSANIFRFGINVTDDGKAYIDIPETKGTTTYGLIRGYGTQASESINKFYVDTDRGYGWVTIPDATVTQKGLMTADDQLNLYNIYQSYVVDISEEVSHVDNGLRIDYNYHSNTGTSSSSVLIPLATETESGIMSAEDKTKLDRIQEGTNNYILPIASNNTLGGIKVGNNFIITSDGTLNVQKASNNNPGLIQGYDNTMLDNGYAVQITNGLGKVVIPDATVDTQGLMAASDKIAINSISTFYTQEQLGTENDTSTYDTLKAPVVKTSSIKGSNPGDPITNLNPAGYVNIDDPLEVHYDAKFYAGATIGSINLATWLPVATDKLDKLPTSFITYIDTSISNESSGISIKWAVRNTEQHTDTNAKTIIPFASTTQAGIMSIADKDKIYHSPFIIDINTCTINTEATTSTNTIGVLTLNTTEHYNTLLLKAFDDDEFNHNFIVKGILKTEYIEGSQVADISIHVNSIISKTNTTQVCKITYTDGGTDQTLYGMVDIKVENITSDGTISLAYNIIKILATMS